MIEDELVTINVRPGSMMESQSGLQNLAPRIFGRLVTCKGSACNAAILLMHPTSNFLGHYMPLPLAQLGISCLALNSRYVGSDMMLSMERILQDVGAGVSYLLRRGFKRVYLFGNSGGAALSAFYQAQAELLTVTRGPDGGALDLVPEDLPRADGIILTAAHPGRSRLIAEWLDPSVIDERDAFATNCDLDLYAANRRVPFDREFVDRFRAAQIKRRDRIDAWVQERLRILAADPRGPQDQAFLVFRTHSDPRFLDLSLDANDRAAGSIWGDPRSVNYGPNAMGRVCTLRSWLSQWSAFSNADGPTNLRRTAVPVLLHTHTADASTFPSTAKLWREAAGERLTEVDIRGGNHYLYGQPELVLQSAASIREWIA